MFEIKEEMKEDCREAGESTAGSGCIVIVKIICSLKGPGRRGLKSGSCIERRGLKRDISIMC